MRNLEEIEKDLAKAREDLANVRGSTAEVYSRIVGYYRSVRNWNKGKREEYGERKLYDAQGSLVRAENRFEPVAAGSAATAPEDVVRTDGAADKVLLFVRSGCPACPAAKKAASGLGLPVQTVDAGTDAGLAEAAQYSVLSTPTAILLSKDGMEIGRARDSASIAKFRRRSDTQAA